MNVWGKCGDKVTPDVPRMASIDGRGAASAFQRRTAWTTIDHARAVDSQRERMSVKWKVYEWMGKSEGRTCGVADTWAPRPWSFAPAGRTLLHFSRGFMGTYPYPESVAMTHALQVHFQNAKIRGQLSP